MNYSDVRYNLEKRFNDNWTDTDVIVWENSDSVVPTTDYWVRLTILPTSGENAELGSRVKKTGLVILQIYGPKGLGTGKLFELADSYNTLMQNYRFPGLDLFTYAASPEVIGESPSFSPGSGEFKTSTSGFFQINSKIPFEAF